MKTHEELAAELRAMEPEHLEAMHKRNEFYELYIEWNRRHLAILDREYAIGQQLKALDDAEATVRQPAPAAGVPGAGEGENL